MDILLDVASIFDDISLEDLAESTNGRLVLVVLGAISTAEAELYSMTEAYQELAFINGLLQDFNMHVQTPLLINDNQSAIAMAEEARFSRNSRHIEIRYRFLHEHVRDNTLTIKYIPSADNIADILTKILPAPRTRLLRTKIMSE